MDKLIFSYNWNNKLDCKAFSTIRIFQPERHYVGKEVELMLKDKRIGIGTYVAIKPFLLEKMTTFMAYIDTGYSLEECKGIIQRMYPTVDFSYKQLAYILILKR